MPSTDRPPGERYDRATQRRAKLTVLWVFFAIALLLAAGAVYAAALRSTIPRALDGQVALEERLLEHRAGVDDVFIITLENGRELHVDEAVAEVVAVGDRVRKDWGSRTLYVNGEAVRLGWSRDTRRIGAALVLLLAMLGGMVVFESRRGVDLG